MRLKKYDADCIIINGDRTKETLAFEDKITKINPKKKMHFFIQNILLITLKI